MKTALWRVKQSILALGTGLLLAVVWTAPVSAQQTGQSFRDCSTCPEMVVLPKGTFKMGSRSGYSGEKPVHDVRIGERLAVGKYEVTADQFRACMNGGGCRNAEPCGRGREPVACVSWNDAWSYALWLFRETGKRYRLPSEAEWEYAARAGTRTKYHFGNSITPYDANYGELNGGTMPVGSYPENAFGLHDMHGNVGEWVEDCWNDGYSGAPSDGSAWQSGNCSFRVLRGGSWFHSPGALRSANRGWDVPGLRNYGSGIGFRVARTLD